MPLTREQTDTINSLVKAKEIDAARKLLTQWKAADALAKLNARHPEPKASKRSLIIAVVVGLLLSAVIACVVLVIVPLQQKTAQESRLIRIDFEVDSACQQQYRSTGSDSYRERCDTETQIVMTAYPSAVSECFDSESDTSTRMLTCLNRNGVHFGN